MISKPLVVFNCLSNNFKGQCLQGSIKNLQIKNKKMGVAVIACF